MNLEEPMKLEELIALTQQEKRKVLDLGVYKLEVLPPEIWSFHWLEALLLGEYFDSGADEFPSADGCHLTVIPAEITQLKNLKILSLNSGYPPRYNSTISDFSLLWALESLEELYLLGQRGIGSLQGIESLTRLKQLNLSYTELEDYSPLAHCTNLTSLELDGNKLTAVDFLKPLTNLTHLSLGKNEISNLDALTELNALKSLCFCNNKIETTNGLRSFPHLLSLCSSNHGINDYSFLSGMPLLEEVLDEVSIPFEHLKENKHLLHLRLEEVSNEVIEQLTSFTQLESLALIGDFNEVAPLSQLKTLSRLWLESSQLDQVQGLCSPNLNDLSLIGTALTNIDGLAELKGLTMLFLRDVSVEAVDVLPQLPELRWVNLLNTQVKSVAPLVHPSKHRPGFTLVLNDNVHLKELEAEYAEKGSEALYEFYG